MNKVLFALISILFCKIAFGQQIDSTVLQNNTNIMLNDSIIQLVLETGSNYINTPYKYAGTSKNGMDCSGFVCTAYKGADIALPHSSGEIAKQGVYVTADNLQPGDLIFFKGRSSGSIGHVAMVSKIVDDLIYIIHATTSRGVMEEVLQHSDYFNKRWLFNKRIVE